MVQTQQPSWVDYKALFKLKEDIKRLEAGKFVELACACQEEAEWYARLLTKEELGKIVKLTWTKFE